MIAVTGKVEKRSAAVNESLKVRKSWEDMSLEEHMQVYESQGTPRKEAMKLVAKDRGMSKRDVYQALLKEE